MNEAKLEEPQEVAPPDFATMQIGVIGERDLVMAFGAVGVRAFSVGSEKEAQEAFRTVVKEGNFGILLITADWIGSLLDEIDKLEGFPIIVEIPDLKGTSSMSEEFISRLIERAIGVDITKQKGESE